MKFCLFYIGGELFCQRAVKSGDGFDFRFSKHKLTESECISSDAWNVLNSYGIIVCRTKYCYNRFFVLDFEQLCMFFKKEVFL